MPFHDDAPLIQSLRERNLLNIFENRPGGVEGLYRPLGFLPWLLTRDLLGWFNPAALHMWNVWAHLLNTALVARIALYLGALFKLRSVYLALASSALFGFAPLSYEAVLWASALPHLLAAIFGLLSLLAYLLSYQVSQPQLVWKVAALLALVVACLSHETGFLFGVTAVAFELVIAVQQRCRPRHFVFLLLLVSLSWVGLYRLVVASKWMSPDSTVYQPELAEVLANFAYHAQNFTIYLAALLRGLLIALKDTLNVSLVAVIVLKFLAIVAATMAYLRFQRRLLPGVLIVTTWLVTISPSLILPQDYVWVGPRLTYLPSVWIALFWGTIAALLVHPIKPPRAAVLTVILAWTCIWSASYVSERLRETSRLTQPLKWLDRELQLSAPHEKVLLINASFTNFAARPAFLIGREGMPIWQYGYKARDESVWMWPAAISGVRRETLNVRHEASLTNRNPDLSGEYFFTVGEPFYYAIFGERVDDAAIRKLILQSNIVFRFDYDPPGFRATRLARLSQGSPNSFQARLSLGSAEAYLSYAKASRCDEATYLELA